MCVNLKTFNDSFREWSVAREDETLTDWPIAYSSTEAESEVISESEDLAPDQRSNSTLPERV